MLQFQLVQLNSNQFSPLSFLGSVVSLNPTIVWILFAMLLIVFAVVSFILSYHWKRYAFDKTAMAQASLMYFLVSAGLMAIMAISLAVYINSV